MPLILPLAAGAAVYMLLRWMLSRPDGTVPLDHPNERSLHSAPVPRVGGVALCLASLPILALAWSPTIAGIAGGLALLSHLDDRGGMPISARFVGHLIAAVLLMALVAEALLWPALLIGVLATAWMINLYNFMDGSDGLAGGMAVIGFGAYAIAAGMAGLEQLTIASATLAFAAAAFLRYNLHPARTFMGDAGSIPLGFLAAAIGFIGWRDGAWPWWFPVAIFSPFIVDATVTLARRVVRGERFWAAHRSHYYQRLVQIGWGHRKTAYAEFGLMFLCAGAALLGIGQPPQVQMFILAALAAIYISLAFVIGRLWKNHESLIEAP